jgi:hypothetical protein
MTPDELRDGARALYEARAAELGLDPWRPGAWRDEGPSFKQRSALTKAAGTDLAQLDADEAAIVRAVAVRPDAAGRGAVHDCLAVTFGLYERMTGGARPSRPSPPARSSRPSTPARPAPDRSEAARRLALVEALLDAPEDRLDAVARALGVAA